MTYLKYSILRYWKLLDESWRFAITIFLIAGLFYFLWSWVIFTIQPVAIQNFELSGEPILSIFSLRNNQAYVYDREVNREILTFQSYGTEQIIDQQTGTIWNISNGVAVQGSYEGSVLLSAKTLPSDIFPYHGTKPYPFFWLAMWQRFDANLYATIAENGYGNIPGDTHFPPLFPLFIRLMQPILGNAFLAGLFIARLATLFMLKLLYDVFVEWGGRNVGRRALVFFTIYPTFFFFFSAYSESVFLVSTLLALRFMKNRAWAWAGFWTSCATLTRLQGAALLIPMTYLMHLDTPFLRKFAHWTGLILAGFGGVFYIFLRHVEGTGSVFPSIESDWQARLAPPGETYLYAIKTIISGNSTFIDFLNLGIATIFIILIINGWKKIPIEYNLYMVFNLLIISIRVVETQPLNSFSRFSLTLFPAFFTLGIAGNQPWTRRVIIYSSLILSLYLSGQFFIWGWVA